MLKVQSFNVLCFPLRETVCPDSFSGRVLALSIGFFLRVEADPKHTKALPNREILDLISIIFYLVLMKIIGGEIDFLARHRKDHFN